MLSEIYGEESIMVYMRIIDTPDGIILAACDKELLGKTFSEGDFVLDVKDDFYKGELVSLNDFAKKLSGAYIANLVGTNVVVKAIEMGEVLDVSVIYVSGVPHAQIAKI